VGSNTMKRVTCAARMQQCLPLVVLLMCSLSHAECNVSDGCERADIKAQYTYIYQYKPSFSAAYTNPGFNSLKPSAERSYSNSFTFYAGVRPFSLDNTEVYFNGEVVNGIPFSNLTGLGGVQNSELQKASGSNLLAYHPRFFLRQTVGFGGETEKIESANNQLAGTVDKHRLVITAGKLSITDLFDGNSRAHDGRRDFMNWTSVTHGAFDYAADVRGYSMGVAAEYFYQDWTVRAGRFMVPKESNGLRLNYQIGAYHGDQVELEHEHTIADKEGSVKLLLFRNRSVMGSFSDALSFARANGGGAPDVGDVRKDQVKRGVGINFEQAVSEDLSLFGRLSRHDGQTETYSYAEVERSAQVGISLKGMRWSRANDTLGVVLVRNGLSKEHQEYLAAGGVGFLIGDGQLSYKQEQVFETYYSITLAKKAWLSFNYQHINNPAYNRDRGPVNIFGTRLHLEFI